MANVYVAPIGSKPSRIDARDVGDVKRQLNLQAYSAMVNNAPADDSTVLSEGAFVTLSPASKGGLR